MPLPSDFIFTQNNLQDYEDCPRRFELRHLLRLEWPAPQTEPVIEHEQHMIQGDRFHRLVQQYFVGLPIPLLSRQADESGLGVWWQSFLEDPFLAALPATRWPELTISMPFSNFRLLCKLDLLTRAEDGKFTILDWKTSTARRISHHHLQERWQTRLYRWLVWQAGSRWNHGQNPAVDQIEMVYWFAEFPANLQRFHLSLPEASEIEEILRQRLAQIETTPAGHFIQTTDERQCAFCVYRSLCQRGEPGRLAEAESDFEPPDTSRLNLDQIGEISL